MKISKKCKRKFVTPQDDAAATAMDPTGAQSARPYIEVMLEELGAITQDLEPRQVHSVYESMGHIIQAQAEPQARQVLLNKLMVLPNQTWSTIITTATANAPSLYEPATVKMAISILKTNHRVALAVGPGFIVQLGRIYVEMLQMYRMYSEFISREVATKGVAVTGHTIIRNMRAVKKEVLRLLDTFIDQAPPADYENICKNFLPALLDPVLGDYARSDPHARDAEVLGLMATLVTKLGPMITGDVPVIFDALFQSTLAMITQNQEDFPDHRIKFFTLLRAINAKSFPAFFLIGQEKFDLVINSIAWAFKHLEKNIADAGLNTLFELLQHVANSEMVNHFYQSRGLFLLQEVIAVLTDSAHKPGMAGLLPIVVGGCLPL